MKLSPIIIQIWIPFIFSVILCGLVMLPTFSALGSQMPIGFPAFFCFLPVVFLFVASAVHAQFSALEKRISDLEAGSKKPTA